MADIEAIRARWSGCEPDHVDALAPHEARKHLAQAIADIDELLIANDEANRAMADAAESIDRVADTIARAEITRP